MTDDLAGATPEGEPWEFTLLTMLVWLQPEGTIWKGGETPRLNDPLFKSIAEELRNQTDDLAGAIPDKDIKPWEVIVPTALVWGSSLMTIFPHLNDEVVARLPTT